MPNAWFRFYHEWDSDPKVQMMSEVMQRRLAMLFCWRCKEETFQETRAAFHWRITPEELAKTKVVFIANEFIDEDWNLLNWNRRQFLSDSSTDRVRRHRQGLKHDETLHETVAPVTVTPPDTDTDTDTDKEVKTKTPPKGKPSAESLTLYGLYPRKVGKTAALKAIDKALREKPFDHLLLAVQAFCRKCSRDGTEERFIPHPATWFNRGSYDDDDLQPGYVNHSKENGNGRTNGNHPSPAKERVTANRRALAAIAIERGWLVPDGGSQPDGEAVSESGLDGRHTGVHERPGESGPEILSPAR